MPKPLPIAMWSGPRNLSTAMMYSFGARRDTQIIDEPFYAAYLKLTDLDHPMREQILSSQPQDPKVVAKQLLMPCAAPIFYQKHMTHHMLPQMPREWMAHVQNVFLIRHPARVLASYAKKRQGAKLQDIGFSQQAELFDHVIKIGQKPIVIDATDIRFAPQKMLRKLCDALALNWDEAMLSWPKGGHENDGVWASHWYGAVHRSSGFDTKEGPLPKLPAPYLEIAQSALPHYQKLAAHKL